MSGLHDSPLASALVSYAYGFWSQCRYGGFLIAFSPRSRPNCPAGATPTHKPLSSVAGGGTDSEVSSLWFCTADRIWAFCTLRTCGIAKDCESHISHESWSAECKPHARYRYPSSAFRFVQGCDQPSLSNCPDVTVAAQPTALYQTSLDTPTRARDRLRTPLRSEVSPEAGPGGRMPIVT
ncbi:hypothetical protein FKP32DRAFT_70825 [Trametes sanguinea]|nr:hypothetical protein FKP32DRAFT_70825 [Trametes sanguinea]